MPWIGFDFDTFDPSVGSAGAIFDSVAKSTSNIRLYTAAGGETGLVARMYGTSANNNNPTGLRVGLYEALTSVTIGKPTGGILGEAVITVGKKNDGAQTYEAAITLTAPLVAGTTYVAAAIVDIIGGINGAEPYDLGPVSNAAYNMTGASSGQLPVSWTASSTISNDYAIGIKVTDPPGGISLTGDLTSNLTSSLTFNLTG